MEFKLTQRFFKFRQVFNHIRAKCQTANELGCHTCVDEELYPFRGRFKARKYMPKKPARYGIKVWQLVDSETRYLLNFDIYLGKEGNEAMKGLAEKVVLELTRPINQTGRNVTTDNYFTSKSLATKLWDNELTLVGTIRNNRKELPAAALPSTEKEISVAIFLLLRLCNTRFIRTEGQENCKSSLNSASSQINVKRAGL